MKRTIPFRVQGATFVEADGEGPSVSVVVSQVSGDPGGWTVELRAALAGNEDDAASSYTVARLIVPPRPPGSNADRLIFVGAVPGARRWTAVVTPPALPLPPAVADLVVELFASYTNAQIVPVNGALISP